MAVDWLGVPSTGSLVVFLLGWGAGWVGFLRAKSLTQLPSAERVNDAERTNGAARATVSVIVPCRNEADNLQHLLPSLYAALQPTDEVIIVDDDSTDGTAAIAARFTDRNVQVLPAGSLPAGWAGKSHACWIGAQRAS
ncbi:MAG: glycosyltransferase family 2 protein, partial [Actinomycetota bacterium]